MSDTQHSCLPPANLCSSGPWAAADLPSPRFLVQHAVVWHGTFLWLVWVCCPVSVPSQLLIPAHTHTHTHPQAPHRQEEPRSWNILYTMLALHSNISVIFTLDPKHNTIQSLWRKLIHVSAETRAAQFWICIQLPPRASASFAGAS